MSEFFYRFRSIDALLGERQELEKQEIYFAHPEELNDPMEGHKDIFWQGDIVLWKNLIKHYILCLDNSYSQLIIGGEQFVKLDVNSVGVFINTANLPSSQIKKRIADVTKKVLEQTIIAETIVQISTISKKTPIRRNELNFYLQSLHGFIINCLHDSYTKNKLIPPNKLPIEKIQSH
jgi:hypothetical protein